MKKLEGLKQQADVENKAMMGKNLKGGLKRMFTKKNTILLDDVQENTELMRRLRAWKINKKAYEEMKWLEQLKNTVVDMDDAQIKIMIIKLMHVEKLLK